MTSTPDETEGETPMEQQNAPRAQRPRIALMWTVVGVPLAYGIYETLQQAAQLFG